MTNLIERLKHLKARIYAADGYDGGVYAAFFKEELYETWPELLETIERLERENATYQGVVKALHEERLKNRKLLAVVDALDNLFERRLVEDSPEMDAVYEAYVALEEKE